MATMAPFLTVKPKSRVWQ